VNVNLCVCDAETFNLNDAEDYAICESWQKILKKGTIYNFKNILFEVCFMFGSLEVHVIYPLYTFAVNGKKLF
jgi:hypothetical protein